jgi:hypothetical protein
LSKLLATDGDAGGAPVCGFSMKPVAAQGFQAETYFCSVFYLDEEAAAKDPAKFPKTIVLKTTASNEVNLGFATMMSSYLKEATVYNTLPALLPIAMPKVYGAYGTVETCMLVLEDLRGRGSLIVRCSRVCPNICTRGVLHIGSHSVAGVDARPNVVI